MFISRKISNFDLNSSFGYDSNNNYNNFSDNYYGRINLEKMESGKSQLCEPQFFAPTLNHSSSSGQYNCDDLVEQILITKKRSTYNNRASRSIERDPSFERCSAQNAAAGYGYYPSNMYFNVEDISFDAYKEQYENFFQSNNYCEESTHDS